LFDSTCFHAGSIQRVAERDQEDHQSGGEGVLPDPGDEGFESGGIHGRRL